ncbi:signal peptidase II [Maricaulis alexandrii]|uniref:signal peptidase II n=1 Tax=Maricaulis alexandrii TaxID=2570354 RepID=UPI00110A03C7|nr:signal peptidase II [Maricaulis alexandrii]
MPIIRPAYIQSKMFGLRRIRSVYLIFWVFLVAFDLIVKSQIERLLVDVGTSVPLVPGFNLTLGHNRGVSFGVLDSDHWIAPYILSSVAVVLVVAVLIWTAEQKSKLVNAAGILFASGGLANAIDRLGDGVVTDYLDFGWQALRWPTFNLADVFIFIGAALLILGWKRLKV